MQRHRSSRFLLFALFALIASLVATVASPTVAGAASTVGSFEIDGNLADDTPGSEPLDWETIPNPTNFSDTPLAPNDNIFTGGSKELVQSGWTCGTGSAPGKDDILSGQLAFRTLGGKQYLYANFFRAAVNGDAHMDYEFNQASSGASPGCPNLPVRTVNDLLVSFDTENGGKTIIVRAFTWTGSTFAPLAVGSRGVTWDGAVNIPPSLTIPGHANGDFGEVALNLTDTVGTIECGEFAGAYMKTRASTSINAALKDHTTQQPLSLANCPNVSRSKSASPNPANVGQVVTYTITYTNTGGAPKTYATIVDNYDQAHLTVNDATVSNGGVDNNDTITWTNITVPANDSVVLTYQGTVTGTFSGGNAPCSTGQFPVVNNVTDSDGTFGNTLCVNAAPNVTRVKSASPNPANVGQVVTYTITYTNTGAVAKTFPTIVDNYDQAHLTVNDASITPAGVDNNDTITWTNITVPANGQVVLTYQGTVTGTFSGSNGSCPTGQFPVINTVTDSQGNFGTTLCVTAAPNVTRVKSASPNPANVGQVVTYTITYTNTGAVAKTFPSIVDDYDQTHLTVNDATVSNGGVDNNDTITWTNITVPANGQVVLTYQGTVTGTFSGGSAPCPTGQFPVVNTVTDSQGTFSATLCVIAAANVTRTKTASPNPASVGQVVTYTITYTNTGAVAKTFPSIVDDYDQAHLTVNDNTVSNGGVDNNDTITWTNITVPANGQVVLTYQGTVTGTFSGGNAPCPTGQFPVVNTVTDSQGTFGTTLCVTAAPNVTRVKSASPNPASVGQVVTYTITYTNTGAVAKTFPSIVDDYDQAHLTVNDNTVSNGGVDNNDTITWTNITVPANGQIVLTYQGTVTGTFGPGGDGVPPCSAGQFQVPNSVTDSQGSFGAILCVTAAPNVTRVKTASPNPANLNQVVTYTITYTNTGPVAKTFPSIVDDYDQAHIAVNDNTISNGGVDDNDTITWTNITVPANGQVVLTYQGTVTGTFTGTPGGAPCTSTQFQVLNTVTDSQGTITNTLCVNGPVILNISKTACPSPAVPGGVLTYTITFSNTGQAPATGVTVTDSWPQGTPITVISTDGGTQSGNSITWDSANIGTLDPGETNTRTVQVLVDGPSGTVLEDTATITATGATAKTTGVVSVPVSNAGAATRGMAYGADADVLSLALIDELGRVDTAAPPGPDVKSETVLPIVVPTVVSLGIINTASASDVGDTSATTTSSASVADVNLLGGLITADVVKGVSKSSATPFGASGSSQGSTIVGLRINNVPIVNVNPGATFRVKDLLGITTVAEVRVLEETKSATLTNGRFTATHSVNMLHVTVLKPLLGLPKGAEIIVSHAESDATYPSGFACGAQTGLVSGKAFTAYVDGTIGGTDHVDVEVGNAEITPLGGSAENGEVVDLTGVVTNGTTVNTTSGSLLPHPNATARSRTEGVNVLNGLITADVLDVSSTSTTTATTASTSFTRTFANLRINGNTLADVDISPNTVITVDLGALGKAIIILDERIVAGDGIKHTEGTINAIHVYVVALSGAVTAEVIVASAHSDAHHA